MISKEELDEIFEEIVNEINLESKKIRSDAYGVTPESNYSIAIRDEFNKNLGKIQLCERIRRKIREALEKKEKNGGCLDE